MHHFFTLFFLILASSILLPSCADDEAPSDNTPNVPFENSNLDVWVQVETDTGLANAPGARILLYATQSKRDQELDVAYAETAGADGKRSFKGLKLPAYWIVISLPQPDGRVKQFHENEPFKTPGGTVLLNNLHVIFEK